MKLKMKHSNAAKLLGLHSHSFQSLLDDSIGFEEGKQLSFSIRRTVTWMKDAFVLCCPTKHNHDEHVEVTGFA